jgi:DNA-binding response OmpR family regulator
MKKILVVDDERSITTFLKTYLEDTGRYEVRTENTGEAAYQTALKYRPDLIFLDIMMKDMSGDAVAEKIRGDETLFRTPIIFLTGIVTKEEVQANGGTIGGFPYIAKPIMDIRELVECIEKNTRKGG